MAGRFSYPGQAMTTTARGLTTAQRRAFEDRGLLKLPGLLAAADAEAMADRLWDFLAAKHGLRRGARETWTKERPFEFGAFARTGAFAGFASPAVRTLLDDLMGEGHWAEPPHWGQPLVCFPSMAEEDWRLPSQIWHLDGPIEPPALWRPVGRLFAILAPVAPRGGGTLVAAGSHRLALNMARRAGRRLSSGEVRKRLRTDHPWFAELADPEDEPRPDRIARFMDRETVAGGVALRVEEMTGEPGDVWLMHQNALHAPAPNARDAPRLVISQFVMSKAS